MIFIHFQKSFDFKILLFRFYAEFFCSVKQYLRKRFVFQLPSCLDQRLYFWLFCSALIIQCIVATFIICLGIKHLVGDQCPIQSPENTFIKKATSVRTVVLVGEAQTTVGDLYIPEYETKEQDGSMELLLFIPVRILAPEASIFTKLCKRSA